MSSHPFLWRRLHSLMGLWLLLFLMEHLLTNSQAALWVGENGRGFVDMVNAIHNLPYLQVVEVILLGVPLLIHAVWGIKYALTSKPNVRKTDGSTPHLPLARNRAYSWQRITSWILLFGLIFHVTKFRFIDYPEHVEPSSYRVSIHADAGLYPLAEKLDVTLQETGQKGELFAVTPNFGTASLLMVRDTFKSPLYISIYTLFVAAACFHACNGLWTFLITWGLVLKASAQRTWVGITTLLMLLLLFLGLAAIWGTYWINLK